MEGGERRKGGVKGREVERKGREGGRKEGREG
jgi:hypothetical protein